MAPMDTDRRMSTDSRLTGVRATSLLLAGILLPASGSMAEVVTESPTAAAPTHMSNKLRESVSKVVVLPTATPAEQGISGTYDKETKGLVGGALEGSQMGRGVGMDVGGIPVNVPFPILTLPGAIFGGLSEMSKEEIQEFRDTLTEELADAASQPLSNDALASNVFWNIRDLPQVDARVFALTTPIPEDTEAVLYVAMKDMTIDVQKDEAIITTTASAALRRVSDGQYIYQRDVWYQDRDTLSNWTKNDSAAWKDYANFARHYIGEEISAEVFDRVEIPHELLPEKSSTVSLVKKNPWQGVTKTTTPTLAWNFDLTGDSKEYPWASAITADSVSFDVEIYDMHRPVYAQENVRGEEHALAMPLPDCGQFRWTVRPVYHVDGDVYYGDWMRQPTPGATGNGNVGRAASEAPAYLQDFALLEVKCGRK